MLVFVTGPRGAGKTTFAGLLLRSLTADAPVCRSFERSLAFLSRRLPDDTGYDLEILQTPPPHDSAAGGLIVSRGLPLARRRDAAPDWTGDALGPWVFSGAAFRLAETRFEEAFVNLTKEGLFILDEVGPLELKLGRGYSQILSRLPGLHRGVVVVRPGLLSALAGRVGATTVIEVEPGAVDDGPELQRLLRRAGEALS
ncbi:MAG: hypothetical protein ACOCW6_02785 [Spirochaetota bacterium]